MKKKSNKIELNRWLASFGDVSRRKATDLIKAGRVNVDRKTVMIPYQLVDASNEIRIGKRSIFQTEENYEYYVLHKPAGFVSATTTDDSGEPPVTGLISSGVKIYPVGRLDIASEGLLILTNDGDLTYKLTHPKFKVEKRYEVRIQGNITSEKIQMLGSGVIVSGKKTNPCHVEQMTADRTGVWLEFILSEGRYRQIRKMCATVDLHVTKLIRTHIGSLSIRGIRVGAYKKYNKQALEELIGIKS